MHFSEYDTRLAAYAVIVDEHDRLLLSWFVGNENSPAGWTMPGGGVEYDESLPDAVVREVLEETGYTVSVGNPIATNHFTLLDPGRDRRPYKSVRVIFAATITGGSLGTTEVNGTTAFARWIPLTDIPSLTPRADIIDIAVAAWRNCRPAVAESSVRHVLLDADGVLQDLPGGWYAAMEPYLGDRARDFLHETWVDELPMLAGRGDYMPVLAATLQNYGVVTPVAEVYDAVWKNIAVIEESIGIVRVLKRNGYGVHLGTNQERYRGGHMRTALGYDDLFDVSCYSYDLGVAKPDPAFFVQAARRIGADAGTILFIDDNARNVEGAREAGMLAEQWDFTQGHDLLLELMSKHGVAATMTAEKPTR